MNKPLKNDEVAGILTQLQRFWIKWRDCVAEDNFDKWDSVIEDANQIMEAHGVRMVRKWGGPCPVTEEEAVTAPLVNWFLDQLEARSRKGAEE